MRFVLGALSLRSFALAFSLSVISLCSAIGTVARFALRGGRRLACRRTFHDLVEFVGRAAGAVLEASWTRRARWLGKSLRLAAVWCAAAATAVPTLPMRAAAADFYWDADAATVGNDAATGANLGGSGTWDTTTANWWNGATLVPWTNGADNAVFFGAAGTVTLNTAVSAGSLSFRSNGFTLTGNTLTLSGATPSLSATLGDSAVIGSVIAGGSGLTMTGGGAIRLENNANSYTGTTTIRNGTLIISGQGALGADTSEIVVVGANPIAGSTNSRGFGGGSLLLDGSVGGFTLSRDLSLQGQGPIADRSAALISLGDNTVSGTVRLSVASGGVNLNTRVISSYGTLTLSGTVNVPGTAATTISTFGGTNQAGVGMYNLTGTLTGSGTLEKAGGGTLLLNPADTSGFSGTIRVGGAGVGQSSVRMTSPTAIGSRTSTGTGAVLDMSGGLLELRMNAPELKTTGGSNANVYGRSSSTFFVDHAPGGSAINGTLTLGSFVYEDNATFTIGGRNGYGMSFTSATVNGGNANTAVTNNLQGGGVLSFSGNFWNNNDNGGARTMTIGGAGDTLIGGNLLASAGSFNHVLTKSGSGTLTISSVGSTLDGAVNVSGGTLAITDFRSVTNNTQAINIGSSTTAAVLAIGTSAAADAAGLTTDKVVNLAGTTGGATINANQTGANPVIFNSDFTATGAGSKTLTLGGTSTADNAIYGAIVNNSGTNTTSVTKVDAGTWVLGGTNAYTGATTIANGVLKLQANAAASTILNDASAVTFGAVNVYAGGTLEFVGQAGVNNVENLGALTPTLGSGTIKLTAGAGGTASLVFASLGTIGDGASVNIVGSVGAGNVTITGLATGRVAPNFYFNGADFAYSDAGVLRAPIYGTDAGFVTSSSALTAASDNEITGSFATDSLTINTLKINGGHTLTLNSGQTLTVRTGAAGTDGGILATGGSSTIAGGTGITTGGGGALMIRVDGATDVLQIDSALTNGTTGGLTKTGLGTLILTAANNQSGTISINEGTVRLSGSGRLGASADLTMRQGTTLDLNGVTPSTNTNAYNNNGTITNGSSTAATFTVGGSNGTGTSNGVIEDGVGVVNLTKIGTGAQTWNGLSTYTGVTTIGSTGIVSVSRLANVGVASGIGKGNAANNAGSLVFNGASSTQAYGGLSYIGTDTIDIDRLFTFGGTAANSGARLQANGVNGAAMIWSNAGALAFASANVAQGLTLGGASTGDNRFNPLIQNNGTGVVSVYKADAGVWHLGNAANSYSGVTRIDGGTLYAQSGTTLPTASNLTINGGSLAATGAFTRTIGTGAGNVQWTGSGSGGFSAGDTKLTVDFGSNPVWGSTPGFIGTGALWLNNSGLALAEVEMLNGFEITLGAAASFNATTTAGSATVNLTSGTTAGLAVGQTITGNSNIPAGRTIVSINSATQFTLSSGTGVTAATGAATNTTVGGVRQIVVGDNANTGADYATISGVISGAGTLQKEGSGVLFLRGANTYTGATNVTAGTLLVTSLGLSTAAGASSVGNSALGNTDAGAVVLGNGGTGGAVLQYLGAGETSDRKIRFNSTTGGIQLHADGTGAVVLTNVANDLTAGAKTLSLRGTNTAGNRITSILADNGGALGITVDGGATWILSAANTYTGTTSVNAGALGIGDNAALGSGSLSLSNSSIFAYGGDRTVANSVLHVNNTTQGFMGDYSLTFTAGLTSQAAANNIGTNNNLAAGKALTFDGATFNSLTANRTWTIDGPGTTVINGNFTTSTAFGVAVTKNGDGVLQLNGTASNFNQAGALFDLDRGTLKIGANEVLPDGAGFGGLTISPELSSGDVSVLDLNGFNETVNAFTANSDGTIVIDNTSANDASFTFGANDSAVNFGNGTGTYTIMDSGSGKLSIFKAGSTSTTIPQGVTLTYQGTTGVTGGSLTIASAVNGTTGLSVRNSGSLLALSGGITAPSAVTSIVVENGATLSLLDGTGSKLNSLTTLQLGSAGGANTTLNVNVGDADTAGDKLGTDTLTLLTGGTLSVFAGNKITLNLTDAGLSAGQTYELLHANGGGFTSGSLSASDYVLGATPGGFTSLTLTATDTSVFITTGTLITGTAYWRGLTDTTWNGAANNWSTDKAGTIAAATVPGQGTDVVFQWNAPTNAAVTTTLEQNFRINSLTFEASTTAANTPTAVTINPGTATTNRLDIAPQSAADGIRITAGGPANVTIASQVRLGADQTWDVVDAGSTLTIGALRGEHDVTKTGAGKVILSTAADPTFNSGLTADFVVGAGTLELRDVGALGNAINGNTARVTVNGGAFYYNGATAAVVNNLTLGGGTLSAGTANQTYGGAVNVAAESFVNLRDNNSATVTTSARNITLSGVLSGAGRLNLDSINTLTGGNMITGTLTLSNANTGWSGGLQLARGTVTVTNVDGLGTGDIAGSAGRIIFNTAGGTTFNLAQNITVDAAGGILELSADASGTPTSDLTVNLSGVITLGSPTNADNALRVSQASDNFSVFNITNSIVLGNNASISYQGSSVRPLVISAVISDGGAGRNLAINNELGGWGVTSQTVRLDGANTFSGDLSLTEGTLQFSTVSNAGGPASNLGRGALLTLGAATLNFIGNTSQSTDRAITQTGGTTLAANGTGGASITYAGAITGGANALTLSGTGAGFLTGGFSQTPGGTNDLTIASGDWTFSTVNGSVAEQLLINGGSLTLENINVTVGNDVIVTGATLNLNGTSVITGTSSTSAGLYSRSGGVINLNANDAYGTSDGLNFILLGDSGGPGVGTLNTNTFTITTPRLDLGNRGAGLEGQVDGTGTVNVADFNLYRGTVNANLAGSGTIEKFGPGDVTFKGDNSGLTSTTAARIDEGTLILDYTANNATKLREATGIDLRGGILKIVGSNTAATSQTVGSLTLGSGGSSAIVVQAGSSQTAVLNLGAITRSVNAQDGTVRFFLPGGTQDATNGITTTTGLVGGILGGYATVDDGTGTWFAGKNGNNITAFASTVQNDVTAWVAGDNVTDAGAGFTGTVQQALLNSLRFDAAAGSGVNIAAGGALILTTGGILVTKNVVGAPSLLGGTLASGATASNVPELIITHDGAQTFEIGADIRINHAVTKAGTGTLLLSGNNVYTGYTELQEGTLQVAGGNAIGDASLVTIAANRHSTLQLLADETIGRLQGGSATTGSTFGVVDVGTHTLSINQSASTTFAGVVTGTGGLVLNSGSVGNLNFTGISSDFTGSIVINGGLFQLSGVGQIGASSITINKGGNLLIDNNGSTRTGVRISNTAEITLNSADGAFFNQTRPRGLGLRTDQDSSLDETVGVVNVFSGANYVGLEATTTNDDSDLIVENLVRSNNATLNVRGTNLGGSSAQENELRIGNAGNLAALQATLVGGGGAANTQNVSILPWAIGESYAGALGDANMGNSLVTVGATGFRPLNFATEYDTFTSAAANENVRESLTADLAGLSGKTINALVIDNNNTATINVAGAGAGQTLTNSSGVFLFTLSNGVDSTAYATNLGGFDGGIAVGTTNEYVFHVVNPSSATTTSTLSVTINSPLTSAADLTKSGRGTLELTGVNTAGGGARKTTINEGTLVISDLDNIGGDAGGLVFAGGTLRLNAAMTDDLSSRTITFLGGGGTIDTGAFDLVLANSIGSGVGGLTKVGDGNLALNGTATYTGPTVVAGGTLTIGATNATGIGGDFTLAGGTTLNLMSNTISVGLFQTGGAAPTITNLTGGGINAANGFFFNHTGDTTVVAALGGAGGLLKAQSGLLILGGANTYTGTTEIQAGTVSFNSLSAVGGGPSAFGAPTTVENGVIRIGLTTANVTLAYNGSGNSLSDRILALQGTTGGLTLSADGLGAVGFGLIQAEMAGNKTLTFTGAADASLINVIGGIREISGVLTVVKNGASTWSATGPSNYTGATTIDEGTLKLAGLTQAAGAVTFGSTSTTATAGTLDFSGDAQFTGALVVQTNSDANVNQLNVAAGRTVTFNGNVRIGSNNASLTTTRFTAAGGGKLVVDNAAAAALFVVGGSTSSGGQGNRAVADLSGLGEVVINLNTTDGVVRINPTNGNNVTDRYSTLLLPTTGAGKTTITAATLAVGDSAQFNGAAGQVNAVVLGSGQTTINVNTVNVGTGSRDLGSITFAGTGGTLTVRDAAGTGAVAFNMGTGGATTGVGANGNQNMFDVSGHAADLKFAAVNIGTQNRNSALTNVFSFDQGVLSMTSLTMSTKGSNGNTTTSTMNLGGGDVTIGAGSGTAITLATNTGSGTANATINITGGTVTVAGNIVKGNNTGSGSSTGAINLSGGTLDLSGFSIGGATVISLTAASGTLKNVAQINNGGPLNKTTSDTLTLAGTNGYTGATNVNAGTLALAAGTTLGNTAITVAAGAVLSAQAGGGAVTIGGGTAGLTLASDAAFNMTDGAIGVLNLNGGLTIGGDNASTLSFEIGNLATGLDKIVVGGAASLLGGGGLISVASLAGNTFLNAGSYDLITAIGGGLAGGFTLATTTLTVNSINYQLALDQTDAGALKLLVSMSSPTTAVWSGSVNGVWNANNAGSTNWRSAVDGGIDLATVPGDTTNVIFSTTSPVAANQNAMTLGTNFTINSLTVNDAAGITLNADGNSLTIQSGLTVNSGAGPVSLATPVVLGGAQSWTNDSSNLLTLSGAVTTNANELTVAGSGNVTISGNIVGGAGGLTKQGSGTLTLSGTNSYAGPTSVSGGTLKVDGSLGNTAVTVASGAAVTGIGTVGGAVTIQSGGHFAPGNGVGTTTVGGLTLSAGSIFDFEFGTGNDRIVVSALDGLVVNGGGFNLYQSGTTNQFAANGTYNLIQYAGLLGGTGLGSLSVLNPNASHAYTFGTSGGFLTLTITDAGGNYWAPAVGGGGSGTWSSSSSVWASSSGVQGTAPQGASGVLIFTDAAGTVTVSGTVAATDGLSFGSDGYVITGGQVNLTGSTAANTITVGAGMTAAIESALNVSNGFTKTGGGALTFSSGANVVPLAVVNGGTLNVTATGTLGDGANLTVGAAGAANFADNPTLGTVTADGAVNFNGASVAVVTLNGAGSLNLATGTALTVDNGSFTGDLTGAASSTIAKNTAGTLALDGDNTGYLGTTTINGGNLSVATALGGTVIINSGSFTGAGAAGSQVTNNGGTQTVSGNQSGTTNVSGGTTNVGSGGQLSGTTNVSSGTLNILSGGQATGAIAQTGGAVNVAGQTSGAIAVSGGIFTVQNGGVVASAPGGIQVNAGGTFNLNVGGQITGNGQITVGGTMVVNGTMAPGSTTTVTSGGLLKGAGTTGAIVVGSGGTLSPGNSVDTLSTGGADLRLDNTSNLVFEFRNASGTAGADWDKIDLAGGSLLVDADNINPANRITIHVNSWLPDNSGPGAAGGFNPAPATAGNVQEYDWLFIAANDYDIVNTQPGSLEGRFAIDDSGVFGGDTPFTRPVSSMGQGTFSVRWDGAGTQGAGLYIHYSAIPEPGSMMLCGLGALAAGWYGRRKLRKAQDATTDLAAAK